MNKFFSKYPGLKELLENKNLEHHNNIILGDLIREELPQPLNYLPGVSKETIVKALIASCLTEREIKQVLVRAGFKSPSVVLMDKIGKKESLVCMAMGGFLNRDCVPCIVTFWSE